MPIYNSRITTLNIQEVKRYAGLKASAAFPDSLVYEACQEALAVIRPKCSYNIYDYNSETGTILSQPHLMLTGRSIVSHLAGAGKVAVLSVTVGSLLEKRIETFFTQGNYTKALLLDAAGTEAVEASADQLTQVIAKELSREGLIPINRYSPGYGDWDVTVQPAMLNLAEAHKIGVDVTSSCMLIPRKSITAIIGLVPHKTSADNATCPNNHNCQLCSQTNCLARKEF